MKWPLRLTPMRSWGMFCKGIIGYHGHWHTPNKKQTDGVLVKGIGIILGCRREWQSGSKVFRVQHKTGETVRVDTDSFCTGWRTCRPIPHRPILHLKEALTLIAKFRIKIFFFNFSFLFHGFSLQSSSCQEESGLLAL